MSNSIRIKTQPNGKDNFLKVELNQKYDFIEILSLKISQEEAYKRFCSDYGVIVGRVVCNQGFGVPNSKVSVFIPITDEDKLDPVIKGLYPYELTTDKNIDGVRYNLLPKNTDNQDPCFTPIGSFPNKREILDNNLLSDIYCKYYKFTTTTNHAGDFMIFGVPLGNYIVQVDTDISDIGIISQKPFDFINKGTSKKNFISPTKFSKDKNIDKLIQVKTFRSGITVKPFWGDLESCEIGINRLDFDLQINITPSAIFMGSIFGDDEKNSINKHCVPRTDLGRICETVTGEGTIEMIRKTIDGDIEEFNVDGGRVIDENGNWAYQVPMNLDYIVTAEDGTLIPSDDPNIGIPTKTSVRFKIGMDLTGGEGRLRTRGKYLIPNNPKPAEPSDYTFDETTKDYSFRDLYWNKIYSVKNFIPRYQPLISSISSRSITAIKDVDDCGGVHTPFPYNRLSTSFNPLFTVLCLIISIIVVLIQLINSVLITALNLMLTVLNGFLSLVCSTLDVIGSTLCSLIPGYNTCNCRKDFCLGSKTQQTPPLPCINCGCGDIVPYIQCITQECGGDKKQVFAPGCTKGKGFAAIPYKVDRVASSGIDDGGLSKCLALQLADTLDVFELDFYNDWINGTLFAYLLKYKKNGSKEERFCEYDCGNFGGGSDGNKDGEFDNDCNLEKLTDTCYYGCPGDSNEVLLVDGLIKKIDDEFYYASHTHTNSLISNNLTNPPKPGKLLFATDIIHLGSIFDCDWQGIPKIQELLVPTTYKRSPLISENDDNGNKVVCGLAPITNGDAGLFFTIDCINLTVNNVNSQNIRKQCEFGVNLDESTKTEVANCNIGPEDISNSGKFFRDVFFNLNNNGITETNYNNTVINTDFTSSNQNLDQFLGKTIGNYNEFRKYELGLGYVQPKGNSYFFYFGILPGKTALDKLNNNYFSKCNVIIKEDFFVNGQISEITTIGGSDGGITLEIDGHSDDINTFIFKWTGPSGFTSTSQDLTTLKKGIYSVTAIDKNGLSASNKFSVTEPLGLNCSVGKIKDVTIINANQGKLKISVFGGIAPYSYEILGPVNIPYSTPENSFNNTIIPGTPNGSSDGLGVGVYSINIKDSSPIPLISTITGLTITGPSELRVTIDKKDANCFGTPTGSLTLNISGGIKPYAYTTTSEQLHYTSYISNQTNLLAGSYSTTIEDSLGQKLVKLTDILEKAPITLIPTPLVQCSTGTTVINFNIIDPNSNGPWNITCHVDGIARSTLSQTATTTNNFTLTISGSEATTNYIVGITNIYGCSNINDVIITKESVPRPTEELSGTTTITVNIGIFNRKIKANPSGGWGNETYKWYEIGAPTTQISSSRSIFVNSGSGTYFAIITDDKGCSFKTNNATP